MSSSTDTSQALALLEEIKTHLEKHPELNAASRAAVVAKVCKLRDAVETPLESVLRIFSQPMQNAALRLAVELGLLFRLAEAPDSAFNLDELAAKIVDQSESPGRGMKTGGGLDPSDMQKPEIGDPLLIVRLMRVLTAMGVCDEVGTQSYTANNLTKALGQEGLSNGVKFRFDCEIPPLAKLIEFFKSTNFRNPADSVKTPFAYALGAPKFEWLRDNPDVSLHFNSFMAGRRQGHSHGSWMDLFPIEANLIIGAVEGEHATFCVDVGGGKGHDLEKLHDRFPSTGKLVLQDQEQIVSFSTIFEPMIHDFFSPQPIKGARMYHLRAVLHDWPTAQCRIILTHIVDAMTPDYSRLIIREFILPDADAPLLGSCNDLLMMVLLAGMERTESQWRELLEGVGLEVVGFWTTVKGGEGVIEAVKPSQPFF